MRHRANHVRPIANLGEVGTTDSTEIDLDDSLAWSVAQGLMELGIPQISCAVPLNSSHV